MTEREVLEEFVDAMRILSMRCRLTVQEIADILNPIGDRARKVLDENQSTKKSNSYQESWRCLECLASSPSLHKMDCINARNNIGKQFREYREMQGRNQYAQAN